MTIMPENASDIAVYHFGLVVPDLDAAVEQYSTAFGFRFCKAQQLRLPVLVDGQPRSVELLASYSIGGPPYLELIEERSGSTWAADAFGMNHMGFWAKDMDAAMARLEKHGMPCRVCGTATPPRMSYHQAGTGVWIELVDHSVRETLDTWMATPYG
jgi:methylmalonyl-CoA/ethylmalonyl-CoA epimerase